MATAIPPTTMPLHPRRAGAYFLTIVGRADDLARRVASFQVNLNTNVARFDELTFPQTFYTLSVQACKTRTPCTFTCSSGGADATSGMISISADGLTIELERTDDGSREQIPLHLVAFLECFAVDDANALRCRIHCVGDSHADVIFCLVTTDASSPEDDEFEFAQWILAIVCTMTALRESKQRGPGQLLWQAARLRILELTCLMGITAAFKAQSPQMEAISFLDAIRDTQGVLEDIAANDRTVSLDACHFLRVPDQPTQ
ncbi:Aste57867_13850 [Aphanomyces stellatus]|uniref:Aste57867_13850 protein n=1 Tax=Aphanomyces stellatus TaxID=120398 RepID=A0A485L035_9STRA|nr:hypothetical protein As57867_013799 [Aphanomyces stellatus]VFT90681.1 Aste57867_13850 [Aphanomyces stellatus]